MPSGAPPIAAPKTEPSPGPTEPATAPHQAPGAADKSAEPGPTALAPADPPKPTSPNVDIRADGTAVVDGKYTLKGKGIKEEPYKVTWDQLVSAQDDYVPKDGRKEIPARIGMLDGKWVELTGYIAFPVMADSQEECLSMMNQWDGCCIGIPPTPYDAVEVHLKDPLTGNARMASYGVVRGRLRVEPQLVGGWLIGLYVMDDATLSAQTYGGIAP